MLVHAVVAPVTSQKPGVGILFDDHAPQGLADRHPVGSVVWILTRGQQHHHGHPRHPRPRLAVSPGSRIVLRLEEIPDAGIVDLADVAGDRVAVPDQWPFSHGRHRRNSSCHDSCPCQPAGHSTAEKTPAHGWDSSRTCRSISCRFTCSTPGSFARSISCRSRRQWPGSASDRSVASSIRSSLR